jgi:hypothetical protein
MNQIFPYHLSLHTLRESRAVLAGFTQRPLAKACLMNPPPTMIFQVHLLRQSNQVGWIHATSVRRLGGDKAGFHAIASIGGVA